MPASDMPEQPAFTVADYLAHLNTVLSAQSGRIKGEVTSINPSGKAVYFKIKDQDEPALLDCLIWVSIYEANSIKLNVGDEIIVTGTPDIYAPYGKFSFKASTIEYAGEGALKKAYDKLKSTLASEGLFDAERKRPLTAFPKKIGVITSKSGVVMQDFTANLSRRGYKISTIDSRVEGKDAIHDLLASISTMTRQDIEVLVIMRGGGSWESLQAFNTESVVRAIAGFKTPVITGIGHDTDVTLAEMVADIGRSTPTAVAETLNEPWDGLKGAVGLLERRTIGEFQSLLTTKRNLVASSSNNIFRNYERRLSISRSSVSRLSAKISVVFARLSRVLRDTNSLLLGAAGIMKSNIYAKNEYLKQLPNRLSQQFKTRINTVGQSIDLLERAVYTNDPKRNMRLGYSLSYVKGKLARSISDVAIGGNITTQLADGEFTSEVKEVK